MNDLVMAINASGSLTSNGGDGHSLLLFGDDDDDDDDDDDEDAVDVDVNLSERVDS